MIQKRETCLYCGDKMESITAKKKFCSDLHRLYYNRELKRGTLDLPKVGALTNVGVVTERKQHNHSMTITVQPQKQPELQLSLYEQYEDEIRNVRSMDELEKTGGAMLKDNKLNLAEKSRLRDFAKEIGKNLF